MFAAPLACLNQFRICFIQLLKRMQRLVVRTSELAHCILFMPAFPVFLLGVVVYSPSTTLRQSSMALWQVLLAADPVAVGLELVRHLLGTQLPFWKLPTRGVCACVRVCVCVCVCVGVFFLLVCLFPLSNYVGSICCFRSCPCTLPPDCQHRTAMWRPLLS
jgi:hypothetical protein